MRAVCSYQGIVKPCPILLVEDIRSIAQQQVARPLQDFALVDVFFHVILRPAYLVQLLIHQFDHMKMVEDMHGVRAVSSTEEMKAAERSVAIYLMSSFFRLTLFQNPPKHRPPCPDPHRESARS